MFLHSNGKVYTMWTTKERKKEKKTVLCCDQENRKKYHKHELLLTSTFILFNVLKNPSLYITNRYISHHNIYKNKTNKREKIHRARFFFAVLEDQQRKRLAISFWRDLILSGNEAFARSSIFSHFHHTPGRCQHS